MGNIVIYKNNFIYTKYDKKAPPAMSWKAYCGYEQSYSDSEESAIQALKDKLDGIERMKENPMKKEIET